MSKQLFCYIVLMFLILSFVLFTPCRVAKSVDASAPSVQWSKTYSGASASYVITTSDQGFLIVSSPLISPPGTVLELIKTDSAGNQVWLRNYPGFPGGVLVVQTSDGGYVLAGTTTDYPSKFFAAKLDSLGTIVWNTTYSDARVNRVTHLIGTSDGGFAILGDSINVDYDNQGALLVKADRFGNVNWNHTYSGQRDLMASGLSQNSEGGYILEVTTTYFDFSVWLIKTDASGNTQWYRSFQGNQAGPEVTQIYGAVALSTSDAGYLLLSQISWYQVNISGYASATLAIKTDANGDQQWNQTYSNLYRNAIKTTDGGYVLGQASSGSVILSKIDELGNMQWNGSYSVTADRTARFVTTTSDGGFALTGTSQNYALLVKLAPAALAPPVQLPPAVPHAKANATILSQMFVSGVGATSAIQTSDGGYAVVGQVSNIVGQASSVLLKTDSSLNVQWSRAIRFDADTFMVMVVQTQDGGYAVVGEKGTDAGWQTRFVLAKFSLTGQLQWNQTYPLSAPSDMYNYLEGFIQTSDGGFLFAATTSYSDTGPPYMVKTSRTGNLIWAKSLTTASGAPLWGIAVSSLVQSADGGFSIIGSDSPHSAISSSYFELIHLDANGTTLWNKSYGNQNGDFHSSVGGGIATSDGGYLLVGSYTLSYSSAYSVLLVKTDSQGNLVWYQTLDGVPIMGAGVVCQTVDGGYVFSSFTARFPCLVKVTSTGQFQGILTLDTIFKENYGDSVADIKASADGAYVIAGQYADLNNTVYDDIWLAKLAPLPLPTIPELPQTIAVTLAILLITASVIATRKLVNSRFARG
jgi:hypothetical protein